MKIFVPLCDEQQEQLLRHETLVPYQPGCLTLSQLSAPAPAQLLSPRPNQQLGPQLGPQLSPDPAPADRQAARPTALPSRR